MDRAVFFRSLRRRNSGVFGTSLSSAQVQGVEAILDEGAGLPIPHLANVLAQVHRETGGGMYPVKETVYRSSKNKNPSDATVIARLDRAFAKGQLPWVSTPYWRNGMFGRGQIQITHDYNYRKLSGLVGANLLLDPSKALDLHISARIAVRGMASGAFTGKKLSDYNGKSFDHFNARSIVNGDKNKRDKGSSRTVGQIIAANAKAFEAALIASGYSTSKPIPQTAQETAQTDPSEKPKGLLALILSFFGVKQ